MKLWETKILQNVFKSSLKEISRESNKSEEKQIATENIKSLYESQQAVIKLFNDYSSTVFEAKYKTVHGKRIPSIWKHVAKVSDDSNVKILSLKQMLQRLPTALPQVKARNIS